MTIYYRLVASLVFVPFSFLFTSAQIFLINEDFSSAALPAGWQNIFAGPGPCMPWEFGGSLGSPGFDIPPHGDYAAVNDDVHDTPGGTTNLASQVRLITPAMNCAGASKVAVEFDLYTETDPDGASYMKASSNGGASWSFSFGMTESGVWRHFYFVIPSSYYSANFTVCFEYADGNTMANGFAVDNVKIYMPEPKGGSLVRPFTSGQMPQTGGSVGGMFHSLGTDTVTSVGLAYSIDGGPPVTGTVSGLRVTLGQDDALIHPSAVSFPSPGMHNIRMWITDINGSGPDSYPADDTVSWDVEVLPSMPPRHPLVEDFTGAWCTFCSDGSLQLDLALEAVPEAIGVGVHNSDQMDSASFSWSGQKLTNWLASGWPSAVVDHYWFPGNDQIKSFPSQFRKMATERLLMYQPAGAEFSSLVWDPVTRKLDGTVQVTFYDTLSGDLRLNMYVTVDSLHGTGSGWDQVNGANTVPGHPYYGLGDPIIGFKHRHVLMSALGGEFGRAGVIPSTVYPGSTYSSSFSLTIPYFFWGSTNQADSILYEMVNAVAIVQRYHTSDLRQREILNAYQEDFSVLTAVSEPGGRNSRVYPNPTTGETFVRFSAPGVWQVSLLDMRGTLLHQSSFTGGTAELTSFTSSLPAGMYALLLRQDSGLQEVHKLIVR